MDQVYKVTVFAHHNGIGLACGLEDLCVLRIAQAKLAHRDRFDIREMIRDPSSERRRQLGVDP